MSDFILLGLILVGLFFLGKYIKKKFHKYVLTTEKRTYLWKGIKSVIFILLSIPLAWFTIEKWYYFHDELPYSENPKFIDSEYAQYLEVESYIMNKQNAIEMLEGKEPVIDTELKEKNGNAHRSPSEYYLVVKVKNTGDKMAWGVVRCFKDSFSFSNVEIPTLPPKMKNFKYVLLFSGYSDQSIPYELNTEWNKVYTIQGERYE